MTCQSGDTTHLGLPGQCDFPAGAGLAAGAEGRLPALSPALCPVGNRPPRANLFGSGPLCGRGGGSFSLFRGVLLCGAAPVLWAFAQSLTQSSTSAWAFVFVFF